MIISAATDYREVARRKIPRFHFDYLDGGAGTESTLQKNIEDLAAIRLRQRVLSGTAQIDLTTVIFGRRLAMPIM
jgi:L-lactate dehydrogenase (cytochrome)